MEKLYTIKDTAELLSVSRNTIWRWIKQNKLKPTKLANGKTRISKQELERFGGVNSNGK